MIINTTARHTSETDRVVPRIHRATSIVHFARTGHPLQYTLEDYEEQDNYIDSQTQENHCAHTPNNDRPDDQVQNHTSEEHSECMPDVVGPLHVVCVLLVPKASTSKGLDADEGPKLRLVGLLGMFIDPSNRELGLMPSDQSRRVESV